MIAVDQLGVNQINCSSEPQSQVRSGIVILCQDSVRFTHPYTTSVLSGPALASILTGLYPFEHGLRSNTSSYLPSQVTTLAELAQSRGYETSFFSGGAPILRKLNLQQGFEIFDDTFIPSPSRLFRPFERNIELFEDWLKEIGNHSFFSVLYVPDLSFIQTETQTHLGEKRNSSYESQLEEFDENLYSLIQLLKKRRLWDATIVVLVGLNGPEGVGRNEELSNLNLFSERTQVGLLMKSSQKPRSQGVHWSFDANVTLADVGTTLTELFTPRSPTGPFPVISLAQVLRGPSSELKLERPILTESGWLERQNPRYGIRWGHYFFLMDEEPRFYNSLIDRLETSPMKIFESPIINEWQSIQKIWTTLNWNLWTGTDRDLFLMWKGLSEIWPSAPNNDSVPNFERLAHRLRHIPEVTLLYSRDLLYQQKWIELEKWAVGQGLADLERIALKNLKRDNRRRFQDPCLALLEISNPQPADLKNCEDPIALSLVEWVLADRSTFLDLNSKESFRRKFLRQYLSFRIDQKIVETNYSLQGLWDITPQLQNRPLTVEMIFGLPELQRYRQVAHKAFQQFRED